MKKSIERRHVSYSQYSLWAACPFQWQLVYWDKLFPRDDNIYGMFGTAMHETIQTWLDILFNKSHLIAKTVDLGEILKENMVKLFKNTVTEEAGQKVYICDAETLTSFHDDGCQSLNYLQAHMDKFFPVNEWNLEGIEIPLSVLLKDNIEFKGYIDIILKHKLTGAIKIIDLKTSTKGWNKWVKQDKKKTNQVLLYKHYYSLQTGVPENHIGIEFLILKRKIYENSLYVIPRVSPFVPSHGAPSVKKAVEDFERFVDECSLVFNGSTDHIIATPSKNSCRYCPANQTEHCKDGVK